MKYTEHIGMLYDTIYYGIVYFNKEIIEKKLRQRGYDLDGIFSFYEEVKNSCEPLPMYLYPFFYIDMTTTSAISECMRTNINFHEHDINDFLNLIINKDKFKRQIYTHLFANISENEIEKLIEKDSSSIINVFNHQNWPSVMTEQTILLVHHFSYFADELYKYLKIIYKHIKILHEKYSEIIEKHKNDINGNEEKVLFNKIHSIKENNYHKQYFSICFINQYVKWVEKDGHDESVFLLGNYYKKVLYKEINNTSTSLNDVLELLGDNLRFIIIQLFIKYGKLTQADICRLTNISSAASFKIVNKLFENNVLIQSEQVGRKIYFKLNKNYFLSTENLYINFLDNIKNMEE